jgi:hypothetical protein
MLKEIYFLVMWRLKLDIWLKITVLAMGEVLRDYFPPLDSFLIILWHNFQRTENS